MVVYIVPIVLLALLAFAIYNIRKAPIVEIPKNLTPTERQLIAYAKEYARTHVNKDDPNYDELMIKYRDEWLRQNNLKLKSSGLSLINYNPYPGVSKLKRVLVISGISLYLGAIALLLYCCGLGFGWIIFICFLAIGYLTGIYISTNPKSVFVEEALINTVGIVALIGILYILGFIWYYFCFGFLVVEAAETFMDYVIFTLISLIGLGFFVGLIAIFFGWNPKL